MRVRYTPAAQSDIEAIYHTIRHSNLVAAQRVEDRIRENADGLGEYPGIGAATDLENVRRLPLVHHPYTIYYRIVATDDAVDILRVVHASTIRNLRQLPG